MYVHEHKSIPQISAELVIPRSRARNALLYGGVKPRDRMAAIKLAKAAGRHAERPTPSKCCWKGGKRYTKAGYIQVWVRDPRHRRGGKYVFEHRLVWELANGKLLRSWTVHHINGKKDDNRLKNLVAVAKKDHEKMWQYTQRRIQQLEKSNEHLERELAELKTDVEALRRQLQRTT